LCNFFAGQGLLYSCLVVRPIRRPAGECYEAATEPRLAIFSTDPWYVRNAKIFPRRHPLFRLRLPLVIDFPASARIPGAAKDKKRKADPALKGLPTTELSPDEAILHALNRLAYGPRPGDVERVRQMGLAKWIEQQLNPNSIDDRAMEARLQDYPTLRLSTAKLIDEYPQPKQVEKQAEKQAQARAQQNNAAPTRRPQSSRKICTPCQRGRKIQILRRPLQFPRRNPPQTIPTRPRR